MSLLAKKVAIVTGAGKPQGVGHVTALKLAAAGAIVVVTDLVNSEEDAQALDRVARSVRQGGSDAIGIAVDVTKRAEIHACVAETCQRYGGVDILFNNAGTFIGAQPFLELTEEHWDLSYRVNLKGMADFCQAVIPIMRSRGGGAIINNASLSGLGPMPLLGAHTASKFAIIGLTKSLASEFGADGIRCNAVCPGLLETRMGDQEIELFHRDGKSEEEAEGVLAKDVALEGRWGKLEEVADTVVYLAGPGSSYITGVALPVAGGLAPGL